MTTTLAIHSHKGGSGKTLVGINLAAYLAKQGKRVAVIDMDLSAPSLGTFIGSKHDPFINDYLMGRADPDEVFFDATEEALGADTRGKLYMALANPSGAAIAEINQRDVDAQLNDLFLMMTLVNETLAEDPWELDYIIIDTSPGLTPNSINGVAITDEVIMVLRLVNADSVGTRQFLETLYTSVQPKVHIIVNQIAEHIMEGDGKQMIYDLVDNSIIKAIPGLDVNFAGVLLNDKDVITNEFNYAMQAVTGNRGIRPIHYLNENSQTFAAKFEAIVKGVIDGQV